jgi:hypothetical protein
MVIFPSLERVLVGSVWMLALSLCIFKLYASKENRESTRRLPRERITRPPRCTAAAEFARRCTPAGRVFAWHSVECNVELCLAVNRCGLRH